MSSDPKSWVTPQGHRAVRTLRVKDEHLSRVLAGKDFLLFDGAMGTQLQARGLAAGEVPELLCLTNPDQIREIHASYVAAGSEVVTTKPSCQRHEAGEAATVEQIFDAAISCARASVRAMWRQTSAPPWCAAATLGHPFF
jgi:5-methyltetrahydrofolate--homocysteine methyltransferase